MAVKFKRNIVAASLRKDSGIYLYKKGVKVKYMRGKDPISFRVLPALPPHTKVPIDGAFEDGRQLVELRYKATRGYECLGLEDGQKMPNDIWVPFVDEDGILTEWARRIEIASHVGHGEWKSRINILSLRSLVELDAEGEVIEQDDPYWTLQQYVANQGSATWGYLQKTQGEFDDPNKISPALPFLSEVYVMNIVTVDNPNEVQLADLSSKTAITSFMDDKKGLVMMLNKHATDEQIEENYLAAYDNGDVTDPETGKVLILEKGDDKGKNSGYSISLATTFDRVKKKTSYQTMRISPELLEKRYDLSDIHSFMNVPTPEQQVQQLVSALNGRTPDGMFHEYSLLREALPKYASLIPDPPMAPGSGSVRGWSTPEEEEADSEAEYDGALGADLVEKPRATGSTIRRWSPPARKEAPKARDPEPEPKAEQDGDADQEEPAGTAPSTAPASGVSGVAGEKPASASSWMDKYRARKAAQAAASQAEE